MEPITSLGGFQLWTFRFALLIIHHRRSPPKSLSTYINMSWDSTGIGGGGGGDWNSGGVAIESANTFGADDGLAVGADANAFNNSGGGSGGGGGFSGGCFNWYVIFQTDLN